MDQLLEQKNHTGDIETLSKKRYSLEEFKTMQRAVEYRTLVNKNEILRHRPLGLDGKPLTDDELVKIAVEENSKAWKYPDRYSDEQKNYFQDCHNWCVKVSQIKGYKEIPRMSNGTPMTLDQVEACAAELGVLQGKNKFEFWRLQNELRVERRDLEKDERKKLYKEVFNWSAGEYKGEKQWVCFKRFRDGEKTIEKRYITRYNPISKDLDPKDPSFFQIKSTMTNPRNQNQQTIFIDVILPK